MGQQKKKQHPQPQGNAEERPDSSSSLRVSTIYNIVVFSAFCVFWLVPISLVGTFKTNTSKLMGPYMGNLHRVACLFTKSVKHWSTTHVEIQTSDNPTWHEMSEDGFFDMPVFGYRSRMHRIIGQSYRKRGGEKRILELTHFIKKRHDELHSKTSTLHALRFVRLYYTIPELAEQNGHFQKPLLEAVPKKQKWYFGEFRFDE